MIEISHEERLNEDEALSEAGTSAVLAAYTLGNEVESTVREALSKGFSSHKVKLKEEYLQKQKRQREEE
jgi:hypothetical protein